MNPWSGKEGAWILEAEKKKKWQQLDVIICSSKCEASFWIIIMERKHARELTRGKSSVRCGWTGGQVIDYAGPHKACVGVLHLCKDWWESTKGF